MDTILHTSYAGEQQPSGEIRSQERKFVLVWSVMAVAAHLIFALSMYVLSSLR